MVIRKNETTESVRVNMRGGDGQVINLSYTNTLPDNCRLFSTLVLEPGCGIGTHVHESEAELFYVLEGNAVYSDNGTPVTLHPGDVSICRAQESHSVKNEGSQTLKLLAVIITR